MLIQTSCCNKCVHLTVGHRFGSHWDKTYNTDFCISKNPIQLVCMLRNQEISHKVNVNLMTCNYDTSIVGTLQSTLNYKPDYNDKFVVPEDCPYQLEVLMENPTL